jgi:death-on-curing protein
VKAAALLHSLTRNHPFLDGNKRAGWNAAWTFIEANAIGRLEGDFDVDAAERLMLDVASGDQDDLNIISARLQAFSA